MNWDGSIAGVENGDKRSFQNLASSDNDANSASNNNTITSSGPQIFANHQQQQQLAASATAFTLPFAKIDAVAAGSPAEEAGLREGDLMLEFGTINHTNHDNLRALPEIVTTAARTSQAIAIIVQRPEGKARVGLTPKPWGGRGLIGCHILPYSAGE